MSLTHITKNILLSIAVLVYSQLSLASVDFTGQIEVQHTEEAPAFIDSKNVTVL